MVETDFNYFETFCLDESLTAGPDEDRRPAALNLT
jgi:hypothetical protein